MLQEGKNTFTFDLVTAQGEKKSYKKTLDVSYEKIIAGDTTLYVDPFFKKEKKNIVREEDDFDGIPTSFLSVGCFQDDQKVIIEYEQKLSVIPACLSYSTKK